MTCFVWPTSQLEDAFRSSVFRRGKVRRRARLHDRKDSHRGERPPAHRCRTPNEETVSGWFSGNPSGSVMTPPLRSPAMPSKPKTVRNNVRVFRRAMPLRAFQPTSHTTALSLQHALNCRMASCTFSRRAIRVQCFRSSFSLLVVTNRVSQWPSS